ncbi:hypothetical protein ACFWP7_31780 [Streptomyces sp. NPDC058470]|uniref:hypothetical protein n=1 Tax=Streptomyces sp. NPDC058470 TaxID=3346515 RepID=UPI0036614791
MPQQKVFEVDVPIHHTTNRALHGVHVFTGRASSTSEALTRAHQVYDAALAAQQAGLENPGRQDGDWGACGVRIGWEPDWAAAKAGAWVNPYSWRNRTVYEL